MRRFFIDQINLQESICTLTGREAAHIRKVLRMVPGDALILMDSQGNRCEARIESINPQAVSVRLEKPLPRPQDSPIQMILCQALLKSKAMDDLVDKVSELGLDRLFPFISSRSVPRLDAEQAKNKLRHWQAIARGAAKQSDRAAPLDIQPLRTLKEMLEIIKAQEGLKVILWEEEETGDLKHLFKNTPVPEIFFGMVGPEGGFSKEEIALAQSAGFRSVSLGQRILRAETAAVTLSALVQYEWGDLGSVNQDLAAE